VLQISRPLYGKMATQKQPSLWEKAKEDAIPVAAMLFVLGALTQLYPCAIEGWCAFRVSDAVAHYCVLALYTILFKEFVVSK
jgi:hypothetical protein